MTEPSKHFYQESHAFGDTKQHEVLFRDLRTNEFFTSNTVEIEVPSASSAVSYTFAVGTPTATVASGTTKTFKDKSADRIFLNLGGATNSVIIRAW